MGLTQGFKGLVVPSGVNLNVNTASIGSGMTYQLIPYITPALSKNQKVYWSVNNNNVTIDDNGLVTGVTDGTSIVTVTTDYGGYTDSCEITIFTVHVTGVTLNESELVLSAGDTYQLEATVAPDDATDKRVTWRSTDTSVATVDNNGLVTSVSDGECEIIVTTTDGNYTASCSILPGLPGIYQEVEYIQSSGTQYINTNYTPTVNTEIETDISWESQSQSWAVFWGVTGNDSSTDGILGRIYWNGSDTGSTQNFNVWFCNSTYGEFRRDLALNTFHNITSKKNGGTTDGTSYTVTTSGTPYQKPIFLFCGNNGGSAWRHSKCKIKTFKIRENGNIVRNFIPCYRKSDNVVGLYDKVGKQFYTNAGSGSFTIGPKIGVVELNTNSISLTTAGATYQLTATTNPASVAEGGFTWTSSDTSIATVSSTGLVTCVTPGNCTITVKTNSRGYTDTCSIQNITTEGWFFYTDGVYYGDKSNTKKTKLSSKVFDYVLYDRKYNTFYGQSGTTFGIINSSFDGFTGTTYTLYDGGTGSIVAKGDYIIFTGKNSSGYNGARISRAFKRSTKALTYSSSSQSGSYQFGNSLYSYMPNDSTYAAYGTGNASYVYFVNLASSNAITSRSYGYNQAETFNNKVILLSENNTLGVQIRDYSSNNTLASYGSTTWGAPTTSILDTGIVDNYNSSNAMYGKIAINGVRNNGAGGVIVDTINNTISSMTMQSNSGPRGLFIPYTKISGYTHFCAFGGTSSGGFGVFNSANNTYNKLYTGTGAIRINIMADGSLVWCGSTGVIYDIDTGTSSTYSGLNAYVGKYGYSE